MQKLLISEILAEDPDVQICKAPGTGQRKAQAHAKQAHVYGLGRLFTANVNTHDKPKVHDNPALDAA